MIKKIFIFYIFSLISYSVFAQDISIDATVAGNIISSKEAGELTITISGGKVNIDSLELPKMDGFDLKYVGPSSKISIVNGQYSSEHSFIYSLFPTKTGHLQIPAMTFNIDGKGYSTKPIDIEVTDSPKVDPNSPADQQAQAMQTIKERIFLLVSTPKANVYLGQKVPLSVKLFVTQLPIRNVQFPKFEKQGFTMDGFTNQPPQYSQTLNGVKYDVVDFQTNIYPTRVGQIELGPTELQASLLYKMQDRKNSNGFFDDEFFNNFFNNYQDRPIVVKADALKLNVSDVPLQGKPKGFSGAVGQVQFEASITPSQVKVGDPVTLRMKLSGNANFKTITMPQLSAPDFKTYEPQIKDEAGGRMMEQVIIPTSDKVSQVPAITFSYFDTEGGVYKTLTQGPFDLKVTAPLPGQEFKAVGFTNLPQNQLQISQVDYIQKYLVNPIAVLIRFTKTLMFWFIILGFAFVIGAIIIIQNYRKRLKQDTAYVRRLNALKKAKVLLKDAEGQAGVDSVQVFYAKLAKILTNYLADQFNKPAGSLTFENISALLAAKKVSQEQINAIKEMIEISDFVRFSGSAFDVTRKSNDLAKLQALIIS